MRRQLDLVSAFGVLEGAVDTDAPRVVGVAERPVEATRRHDPSRLAAAAAIGSALMAATTWQTAATPWPHRGPAWLVPEFVAYYVGLATLTAAWLVLGRALLFADVASPVRAVRRFVLAGALPFMVAAPLGRDLWAYAAQGHLVSAGFSPYRYGPGAAPGAFAQQVSTQWLFTPSPYGPLWLRMTQVAARAAQGDPVVAVLLLRLPAFVGLALCVWAVPVLAARVVRPTSSEGRRAPVGAAVPAALWLGVASPLMLVLGVGGGHNDVLMLGLALAGTAVATRPGSAAVALGAGIATLGVLIKSPAAIAVTFTVPASLLAEARPSVIRVVSTCVTACISCAATLFGVTAATGLGFGWTQRVGSYAGWVNVLSLPSGLTMLGKALTGDGAPRALDGTLRTARTAGEVLTVAVLIAVWVLAVRRPARTVGYLAIAFGASAVLAPATQPWYYLWGLVLAGLVVRRRSGVLALAIVGAVFPIMLLPVGADLDNSWFAVPVLAAAVGLVWLFLGRRPPRPVAPGIRGPVWWAILGSNQ